MCMARWQHLGEDQMIAMLDALRGHWGHLTRRQQLTQVLLGIALLCELCLWLRRVEWGGLLLVYGLWCGTPHHAALHRAARDHATRAIALPLHELPPLLAVPCPPPSQHSLGSICDPREQGVRPS